MRRCAVEETGRNSVRPWTTPSTIANQIDTARTLSCGPMRRAGVVPLVLVLLSIAACPSPSAPVGPHGGTAVDAAAAGSPGADAGAVAEAPAPLTDAECTQLVEHTLEIGMAQQRATKPADYVPTDDQVGAIRAKLIASKPCDGLTRPQWECALAASTQDALYRCAQ